MGQYYRIVNFTKREAVSPRHFDNGLKLLEWGIIGNEVTDAMIGLMSDRWFGDQVFVVGDYSDVPDEDTTWGKVYERIYNEEVLRGSLHGDEGLYDLSGDFTAITRDSGVIASRDYRFIVNHATRQFIDLDHCPETVGHYFYGGTFSLRIHPLPLLLAMGNGRGGGDYRGNNKDLVGSWCDTVQHIDFTNVIADYPDFVEFRPDFRESF